MKKVLFLGDSITDGGVHVAMVDTYFRANMCLNNFHVDNIGLCSENTSGLTEEGHPGARPNIFDRLENIIGYYHADIAVVLYGTNDAIYKPFCEEYFELFKEGIGNLVTRLKQAKISVYLCTPTAFDPLSCSQKLTDYTERKTGMYSGYNEVMTKYAEWIREEMADKVDKIIDINRAMNEFIDKMHADGKARKTGDGIHPNMEMSAIMAQTVLNEGFCCKVDMLPLLSCCGFMKKFALVRRKAQLIHSYEKETLGHSSPFHDKYLPKKQLDKKCEKLDKKIFKLCGMTLSKFQYSFAKGYKYEKFVFGNFVGTIIFPKIKTDTKNWLWRTEFFGAFADADKLALSRGYHLIYLNMPDNYGSEMAVETMNDVYHYITEKFALDRRVYLLGLSRGGIYAVNFAIKYPTLVKGLFLDAPVVNIFSWPKGDFSGKCSAEDWENLKVAYQIKTINYEKYTAQLTKNLASLAAAKIPIALISNKNDDVVPYSENGELIKKAYETASAYYFEHIKPLSGHHPHGGEGVIEALDFLENT